MCRNPSFMFKSAICQLCWVKVTMESARTWSSLIKGRKFSTLCNGTLCSVNGFSHLFLYSCFYLLVVVKLLEIPSVAQFFFASVKIGFFFLGQNEKFAYLLTGKHVRQGMLTPWYPLKRKFSFSTSSYFERRYHFFYFWHFWFRVFVGFFFHLNLKLCFNFFLKKKRNPSQDINLFS